MAAIPIWFNPQSKFRTCWIRAAYHQHGGGRSEDIEVKRVSANEVKREVDHHVEQVVVEDRGQPVVDLLQTVHLHDRLEFLLALERDDVHEDREDDAHGRRKHPRADDVLQSDQDCLDEVHVDNVGVGRHQVHLRVHVMENVPCQDVHQRHQTLGDHQLLRQRNLPAIRPPGS